MIGLPSSLPRASNFRRFIDEPLDFLARARRTHGDIFAVRDAGPVFSRATDCAGTVAVFGAEHQRVVLSDIESFGMPESAAQHLKLPRRLINLNRGLHSMRGDQHSVQKRLLMGMLNSGSVDAHQARMWEALAQFTGGWTDGSTVGLLDQMRELVLQVSCRVLFGDRHENSSRLARQLEAYFCLRREATSPANTRSGESLEQLVTAGNALNAALRMYVRECRRNPDLPSRGILAQVSALEQEPGRPFSEDEIVAHCNVLFVSSTEPVAVSLTWILLTLSQLPALRGELRAELNSVLSAVSFPAIAQLGRLSLLDRVINESLRLLPPNAFMVRITTRPVTLGGVRLPARCEVILCPFLAHRDGKSFPRPKKFFPDRWLAAPSSPFEYFPFGAGGHSCAGKHLALHMMKTTLAFLLPRYDMILAGDQAVDWRLHIMFMPGSDPAVAIQRSDAPNPRRAGKLHGPIGKLLSFA